MLLSLCTISEKTNTQSRENLVTDGTDGKTDVQTDESDFIGRCLTRKIKSKIKLNSKHLF